MILAPEVVVRPVQSLLPIVGYKPVTLSATLPSVANPMDVAARVPTPLPELAGQIPVIVPVVEDVAIRAAQRNR
ncbi:MAG TPA: hypothetical protein DCX25_02450 [Candidatus Pacebacteria bacterium]|nr:hypothetical protein [Candidatus Paceibacterota bacterium]HCR11125.1 hypothetical protein [Candidatus Paceibacterota bacterium]HCR93258.1 hypothetical protein [Candidatus Paceibacterota bacterium]